MENSKIVIRIPKEEQKLGNDSTIKYPYEEISLSINNETKIFETPNSKLIGAEILFNRFKNTKLASKEKFVIITSIIEI